MLLEASPAVLAYVGIILVVVLYVVDQQLLAPKIPTLSIYACEPEGRKSFSFSTRLRLYLDCAGLYRRAWDKYIKGATDHVIVLPGLGFHDDVILPHSSMKWALSQPDTKLSSYHAIVELNQVMHSLGHSRFIEDPWQGHLVRTKLFNAFESMAADVGDELTHALDMHFGTDTERWNEIDLVETLNKVTAQIAGRFTVGLPLCRDKDYIDASCEATDDFMVVAGAVRAMPHILRPLVGSAMGLWYQSKINRMKALFEPLYRERIGMLKDESGREEPNDYLQIMFRYAAEHRKDELASLDIMTRRLIIANFGSIHQPSLLIANTLLNLIDSDAQFNTIATLQDELTDVFGVCPNPKEGPNIMDHRVWTRVNVNRLDKADSLMRETARLHTFGSRAILRKVIPKEGVTTDAGVHLPHGRCVSFMAHPVQMDKDAFDDPEVFDPFRFVRMREAVVDAKKQMPDVADQKDAVEMTTTTIENIGAADSEYHSEVARAARAGPLRFVTTGPNNLTFGHGRHACPGRFVVDFQLKMVIAHVITRYELAFPDQYGGKRPDNTWMADVKLPQHARIRVKRKGGI
ncbi:cytochrome P450 [Apodospora peruviana]|uniref:Cytochrome P450 n=1 Tax=Apodospora peruviana TaxID=516989 RepID=A0AAE0M3Q9_9PEZI|nr:cytochrome P450 [Apodospora peruviana]